MKTIVSPSKAAEYFQSKLDFTTGPVELQQMMKNNEVQVIDVRAPEDFAQGHIPGAVNLPKTKWSTLAGLAHDKLNVVYCYSQVCHLAAKACKHFADNDYPVMELEGGFDGWSHYKMPIEK